MCQKGTRIRENIRQWTLRKYQTVPFVISLDIFTFQISIHALKLDLPKTYSCWRKYQTISFEKESDNGLLLHCFDIFKFQISIHTLKLNVPKKYSRCRKYQTTASVSYNSPFLCSLEIFTFQISIHTLKLDVKNVLLLEKISDNRL